MLSEKLKQAITMIKSGDKFAARKLLVDILDGDPTNETAWLWFTDTLNTDGEKKIALEGLLKINPASQAARLGLERLSFHQNPDNIVEPKTSLYQPAETDSEQDFSTMVESDSVVLQEDDFFIPTESAGSSEMHIMAETTAAGEDADAETAAPPPPAATETTAVEAQPQPPAPVSAPTPEPAAAAEAQPQAQTAEPVFAATTETDAMDETQPQLPASVTAAPVGTQATSEALAQPAAPAAPAAATQTLVATETQSQPESSQPAATKPNKFVLSSGIARILIILAAFAVMGFSVYWFGSMLGLFPATTETACKCTETDAYLLRVQDRVSRWINNQALYVLAETHGDAPQNTDFGQQLLAEEKSETVPVCLKDLHGTLLSTFENHIKYGEAIKAGDTKLIAYYRNIESGMQDTLKAEFEKLKIAVPCTP